VLGRPKRVSSQHTPFRVVPHLGKVAKYAEQSSNSESCDVLHDDVSRSYDPNNPRVLAPEPRTFSIQSGTLTGVANVLTGESAADDIYRLQAGERFSAQGTYVVENWDIGPVLSKHGSAIGLDFAEGDGLHSGSLKSEGEAADA
jgi:hypothetical protein